MSEETGVGTNSDVLPGDAQGTQEPAWKIDANTPGNGDRPSWLPPKYGSAEDLGKGYAELEKKLGTFTGAPEKYDLSALKVDESQLLIQEMVAVGKELNMSQDGLAKFIGRIANASETMDESYLQDEVKKLGKEAETELLQFQNFVADRVGENEKAVIGDWIKTADDLKVFNKLVATSSYSAVPGNSAMHLANAHETVQSLRQEMVENIDKYNGDSKYRANYSKRLMQAVAREKQS